MLSDKELLRLGQVARKKRFNAGATIFVDGAKAVYFANIATGVVKLTKTLPDGRQHIVGLLFPPDFLGRVFHEDNAFFAEAATDVDLCYFPRPGFESLLGDFPGLEHRLLQVTLDELDACRDWTLLLGRKTAEQRVAHFLLLIARRTPNIGCRHALELEFAQFDLPLSRGDIADYLGLTLETVSRQMSKLKAANVIEIVNNRTIVVPDINRLGLIACLD